VNFLQNFLDCLFSNPLIGLLDRTLSSIFFAFITKRLVKGFLNFENI